MVVAKGLNFCRVNININYINIINIKMPRETAGDERQPGKL